jgi:hypothetical protein
MSAPFSKKTIAALADANEPTASDLLVSIT